MKFSKEQIINLIAAYHQNTISDEGVQNLREWMDMNPDNSEEFANYLALLKESQAISQINKVDENQAWSKIYSSLSKPAKKNKSRKIQMWLPYAAAVVIVFVVSYFMLYQVTSDYDFNQNYNFAEVSSVGSKKAILTLDGGQTLILEESLTDMFSEKDGTRIEKDSSNTLKYATNINKGSLLIYNRIDIPRGGEYSLILADGTKVWLNSQSTFKYPVQFVGNTRRVELTGEAYFEVAHNANKPFFVKAGDTEVKVLGTKFNISSYTDEEYIATTLVEGSVQVSNLGRNELLKPGYQAVVNRAGGKFHVQEVNTRLYTSWVNGVFEFKNNSLEEICHQLSRWYNVEFFFTEKQYQNLRFTGAAKREKPVGFALDMIEKMANVKFAIKDDKIIVGRPSD
ncbi:FecR family protein [Ancylomarina sp. 16SWW S1-10-2]|uniref:FecR family protein n=1 Tax=Ancylomarina sp. 16SWW S1-10-2 TaxID=2499681 RepID=UPI0012AD9463|nr:FecR family protein [Ancylomarina sp. 16SWW S1-10-2]MRT92540.1 FecR family protein [Ancylomarina sp. 16SWW S1-10-2]